MMRMESWKVIAGTLLLSLAPTESLAQAESRWFAGAVLGVSALSADAEHQPTTESLAISLYKPENGLSANALIGMHLNDYATIQLNYIWNRNALILVSSRSAAGTTVFFEQPRQSTQHAVVGDFLLYFRARSSRVRPYLSVGGGVLRFSSTASGGAIVVGAVPPAAVFTDSPPALRVAVGIDVRTGPRWSLRYSFSETLSRNPISRRLTPSASRSLANFQNLVGVVRTF